MRRRFSLGILACLWLSAGLACTLTPTATPLPPPTATPGPTATSTLVPSPTAAPTPLPTHTPEPVDSGWQVISAGLEHRSQPIRNSDGELVETVTLLRLDPAYFGFQVSYNPDQPRTVQQWAADTQAAITLNAGYFSPEYTVVGLHVVDGVPHGTSYGDYAGMFTIRPERVEIRWLRQTPYDPNENLLAAVQSFPLLIKPGGKHGFPEEDGIKARRTVIAQDRTGRILLILCPNTTFTLHQLAGYLLEPELDIDVALNLDGGPSSGLSAQLGDTNIQIPSFAPVPAVILINPK